MSGLFWGVLLVLIGAELIFKALFGFNIPIFRIAFGLLFIYIGTTFLMNPKNSSNVRFGSRAFHEIDVKQKYHITFGEAHIDFSHAFITKPTCTKITTLFGSTTLTVNEAIPTHIIVRTSFGNADLPDHTQVTLGEHHYILGDPNEKPLLTIYTHTTFGNITIKKA